MNDHAADPAFIAYSLTASALALKLWLLWAATGAVRAKSKTTPNLEDTTTVSRGAALATQDPEGVARAMRVYNNAAANELPFLVLGLVYVLLGAPANIAWILFGTFVAARVLHAIVYAIGVQPWRTIFFVVGQLAAAGLLVQVVRAALAAV
ncbi:MAG TPA: MAPEG family protein [Polyangia bacterium]|nr:MAPEG family protein [Polyangia bacterium]